MADEVQGFFRMLATSPKTVSLSAGIACATPFVLREQVEFPAQYLGFFSVASVFFLTLFAVLVVKGACAHVTTKRQLRLKLRSRFDALTYEELEIVAAFVVQAQHSLFFPGTAPFMKRLSIYDIVTTLPLHGPLQRFELAGWARDLVENDRTLLKGAEGNSALEASNANLKRQDEEDDSYRRY
ncbi:super-infection exclusion protein B [Achromobacter mucicolens]|uniref:super-infection exclusion protein B n=1 Tax=Achromobacter mucicolens TaxID=1389922 RepID=UPI001CBF8694|nr:super-infection exclusion protein B [Achromobacter mucicolens]UAN04786.1 superinfection exclusion B family protein [Achromobacter mucicolens]